MGRIRVFLRALVHRVVRPSMLLVWCVLTLAATVMGPFNTLTLLQTGERGLYWGVIVGASIVFSSTLAELSALFVADRHSRQFDALLIGLMTLVFSPFVYFWTLFCISSQSANGPSPWKIALFVALIGTVIHVSVRIIRSEQSHFLNQEDGTVSVDPTPEPDPPEPGPRLMRRLPSGAVGPVLRLSASDHFVAVVLPGEVHSLRMRFSDAIDEMDGCKGDCAHRSHWVAHAAVQGVEREGARTFLRLVNGDQIPVSRTYRSRWEEAGLL